MPPASTRRAAFAARFVFYGAGLLCIIAAQPIRRTPPMKLTLAVAALAAAVVPAFAQAQFAKADDAVEYRQSALFLLGNHFGRIGAVVKGDAPFNKDDVIKNAELVATLSKLPWPAFEAVRPRQGARRSRRCSPTRRSSSKLPRRWKPRWPSSTPWPRAGTSPRSRRPSARRRKPARAATTASAPSKRVSHAGHACEKAGHPTGFFHGRRDRAVNTTARLPRPGSD